MKNIIEIQKLSKTFFPGIFQYEMPWQKTPPRKALDDLDLVISKKGQIILLQGANGSGKSTLLRCISGSIIPTSGKIHINGIDISRKINSIKPFIGISTDQERSFYWRLSGRDNLAFFAGLHSIGKQTLEKAIDHYGSILDIPQWLDIPFSKYSTGIRQRFSILRALIHKPVILLFDEPYKSLDKGSIINLNTIFNELANDGHTIIFSSHENNNNLLVSTKILTIKNGKLI